MDITFKSITLLTALLLTGLSAGLFYAWDVSVIPGIRLVSDKVYLEAMQSINKAILNPAFFLIFMGSPLLLFISTIQHYKKGMAFWFILAATFIYLIGTFGVTAAGNVPLNNSLEVLDLKSLSVAQLKEFRQNYEVKWNRLHSIRTVFAVLSFLLSLIGLGYSIKHSIHL